MASTTASLPHRIARRLLTAAGLRRTTTGPTSDRLTVALVLPLQGAAADWMLEQQIDLLRRIGRNPGLEGPPHVTLKMGFKTRDLAGLRRWMDRLAADTPAQTLQLSGLDRFDEGILFLDLQPGAELEALRQRVLRELASGFAVPPGPVEDQRFRFHATLTHGLPADTLQTEQRRLEALRPAFTATAEALELWLDAGSHWVPVHRARLGAATPPIRID